MMGKGMRFDRDGQDRRYESAPDLMRAFHGGIVVGLLICMVCIQGVGAYHAKYHYDLAIDALHDEGIGMSQPQIWYVAEMDNMVDMVSQCDGYWQIDLNLCPNFDDLADDDIEKNFADHAHFYGLSRYDQFDTGWTRLHEQTYRAVTAAEAEGNTRDLLAVLGMSMHSVQDFYAHSNWAEQSDNGFFTEKGYADDVTWFEVNEEDKNSASGLGLSSENHAKDYPSIQHFDTSYRQAYYASRQWIRMVKSWVSPEFWNDAMDPAIDTSSWGGDWNTVYMKGAWYVGAWGGPASKSYEDLFTFLEGDARLGGVLGGVTASTDENYREVWYRAKQLGSMYIYNQTLPELTPKAHPTALDHIPLRTWLTIQTIEVYQTDCDRFRDIDPLPDDQADFYSIITVRGHAYIQAPIQDHDRLTPDDWVELIPIPSGAEHVTIQYDLYDDDHPVTQDDHCDINPDLGRTSWVERVEVTSTDRVVETNGLRGCLWYGGSQGDGNEAAVRFRYSFHTSADPSAPEADSLQPDSEEPPAPIEEKPWDLFNPIRWLEKISIMNDFLNDIIRFVFGRLIGK
jgi:hypothetical protein